MIATLLGAGLIDVDAGAARGVAITSLTSGHGVWQYDTGGGWTDVGVVSATSALLLRSTDSIRFVPDGQNADSATFTYRAWDQSTGAAGNKVDASTTTGGTTAFSTATDTATITVTALNDAPVLTAAAPALTSITEDATTNAGQTVASFLGGSVTDVDTGSVHGIAITSLTSGNGVWQYDAGGGWTDIGAVSATSALLLRSTDSIRFVPDGKNADSGTLTYRAWDQTGGATGNKVDVSSNGGTTAFSVATDTATITVTAVNDAPVLTAIAPNLIPISEDATANAGQTVASFLGTSVADVDAGATQGIAITSLTPGNGTWQYDTGGGWTDVGVVSATSALLLRSTDSIRFVPDGSNATGGTLTYRAWDQTSGAAGSKVDASTTTGGSSAFSAATDTVAITVSGDNDAPVLTAVAPTLTTITEDDTANVGQSVASFLGAAVADVDTGAVQGIAITATSSGHGTWQYNTGAGWTDVGAVSATSALLLRGTDSIRFVPDGLNADSATLTYQAWDQTSGVAGNKVDATASGGATAFSTASDTATLTVTAVNDAPVLTAGAPTLAVLTEDATTNAGQTVASFLGTSVTDVDTGAINGIAITSLSSGNGTWQYDAGGGWTDVGVVSATSALLLRSTDTIRFVPDGENADSASFIYRAWDQSSGAAGSKADASTTTGGVTAFSTATDVASITVTDVNDAPVLTAAAPVLTAIDEDATANAGQTVASFLGASVTDVDTGAIQGVAITALTSGHGAWQYNTGTGWTDMGAVAANSALLLRSTDSIRFVPDGQNADSATLTYQAWDQTTDAAGSKVDAAASGGATAFSAASDTATLTVTAVNDAPVLTAAAPTLTGITEDAAANAGDTIASLLGASVTDVDTGAAQGMAITALASGNGVWQYNTGAGWSDVGVVSATSALLLRSTDTIRFVPDGKNADNATITYQAWDQTTGAAGSKVDATAHGGTTAFSTASDTASITVTDVNDAPVLTATSPSLTPLTEDATAHAGDMIATLL
ncbi:MAG: hypothetical protein HQK87_10450, partial [Nitrospinae bacterium]|nr:hypothetical protein [Nitrospinota bacterium]